MGSGVFQHPDRVIILEMDANIDVGSLELVFQTRQIRFFSPLTVGDNEDCSLKLPPMSFLFTHQVLQIQMLDRHS